jgi:hypothetical protein
MHGGPISIQESLFHWPDADSLVTTGQLSAINTGIPELVPPPTVTPAVHHVRLS